MKNLLETDPFKGSLNKILRFAGSASGSVILTDDEYGADPQRSAGNQPGMARVKLANKALRQASAVASGFASTVAKWSSIDVTDSMTDAQWLTAINEWMLGLLWNTTTRVLVLTGKAGFQTNADAGNAAEVFGEGGKIGGVQMGYTDPGTAKAPGTMFYWDAVKGFLWKINPLGIFTAALGYGTIKAHELTEDFGSFRGYTIAGTAGEAIDTGNAVVWTGGQIKKAGGPIGITGAALNSVSTGQLVNVLIAGTVITSKITALDPSKIAVDDYVTYSTQGYFQADKTRVKESVYCGRVLAYEKATNKALIYVSSQFNRNGVET